jgi:hypothetical protein
MKVRLIYKLDGTRNGEPWPAVGGEIDVPTSEAINLINHGYAVPVPVPQVQERATLEQEPERATLAPATKPKRKAARHGSGI